MKIPPVKGTRDFYPPQMAIHNWIVDGWRKVSVRNGFEEYDGPIFELLQMYQIKSGDEIVEQLFSLQDRGGRDLALRPEITPTLARMVNQQVNSLPKPIKWFSVPRLFRAERPQKGRLREFFQWNIDIIGQDSVLADAEVIFATVDYLRHVGLGPRDVQVKISSRRLLTAVLRRIGIPQERLDSLYLLLDKKTKLPKEAFRESLNEQVDQSRQAERIEAFMELKKVSDVKTVIELDDEIESSLDEQAMLVRQLGQMGLDGFYCFDPSIVRGLAYYTGTVFEVHDMVGELRAIAGGGRYGNLLKEFGGPEMTGTGMGMGDCVLEILLAQKGLLNVPFHRQLDYFVAFISDPGVLFETEDDTKTTEDVAVGLTAQLRSRGFRADFAWEGSGLSKQLKRAAERKAKFCIIIGEEFRKRELVVKDMATGRQTQVSEDQFLSELASGNRTTDD